MSAGTLPSQSGPRSLPEFDALLRNCRIRVRTHTLVRGLADLLLVIGSALLIFGLIDYAIPLPVAGRLTAFCGVGLAITMVVVKRLIGPMISAVSQQELGAAVDMAFPDLHEGVSTLLSLSESDVTADEAGSELMRQQLRRDVSSQIARVSASKVVDSTFTLRRCGFAAIAAILVLLPTMLWPAGSWLVMQRLFMPLANLEAPTNLFFEVPNANRTVATGSTVEFIAIPKWRNDEQDEIPDNVVLELLTQSNQSDSLPMSFDEVDHCFVATLPAIQQSLRYRIISGRASTAWFDLAVSDPPEITAISLKETAPAYTGRAVSFIEGVVGRIEVFERSQIAIHMQFSKPVEHATLTWTSWKPITSMIAIDEFEDSSNTPVELPPELADLTEGRDLSASDLTANDYIEAEAIDAVLSADRTQAVFQFDALGGGIFRFDVVDDAGLTPGNEPERMLVVTEDKAPQINVTGLQAETEVRPDDIVPLDGHITDDLGLAMLELHIQKNEDAVRILPAEEFQPGGLMIDHEFRLALDDYGLKEGDTVALHVRTADFRPVPEPNVVTKGPWILRVRNDAEPLGKKELSEENQSLIDRLTELANQLTKDIETGNELRNQLWKQWDQKTQDGVRQLSEKEQLQGRSLLQLAEEIAAHPLMNALAEELQGVGMVVRDDVPNQFAKAVVAPRDEAAKSLQEGINGISRSRDQLRRIIRELEQLARIEQDLTELNRLALEAEQLAKDSEQLERDQQEMQPEPGQTEEELQSELAEREQQLQQDQQELSNDLDNLLKRREELLNAARRSQLERLEALADKTQQLAKDQQDVADGVAEESRDASRDAAAIADRLHQLSKAAEQLQAKLQKDAADVTSPDSTRSEEAARELRQGNIQKAEDNVAKLQQQVESAAAQLRDNAESKSQDKPAKNATPAGQQRRDELAAESDQLGTALQEIQQQIEQLRAERGLSSPSQSGKSNSGQSAQNQTAESQQNSQAGSVQPKDGSAEGSPENLPGSSLPNRDAPRTSVVESLLERLRQLNEATAAVAESLEDDAADERGAVQAAKQAAQQSGEAASSARAGKFGNAADKMREAGRSNGEAAKQLEEGAHSDQQGQLKSLANELIQLADLFQQLQQDDAAQLQVQKSGQQQIADQTKSLPDELSELAERLGLESLGMQQQERQAKAAAQAARDAAATTQRASDELQNAELQQAGQSGHEAAGQLNRAAQLARQGSQGQQESNPVVPSEVGESVTDALSSLQKAADKARAAQQQQQSQASAESQANAQGKQPGKAGEQANDAAGSQPGDDAPEKANAGGQPSDSGQPSGSESGGESQQGSSSEGSAQTGTNAMSHSTDELTDAADALKNAAKGSLPANFTPGQMADTSRSSGKAQSGTGNDQEFDGRTPGSTAPGGGRWFDPGLHDELDQSLSEQAREVVDGEYAELIRNYRRQLAQVAGESADSGNKPGAKPRQKSGTKQP